MNRLILPLLILFSCSTYKPTPIPTFDKSEVCSESSLKYLDGIKGPSTPLSQDDSDQVSDYMNKVQFLVKGCYEEEIIKTKKAPSFNLCFVTGSNAEGKRDFFEFSSKTQEMSSQFWECLGQIETALPHPSVKKVYMVQPYRLYPKG